jgi:hypothetical protein
MPAINRAEDAEAVVRLGEIYDPDQKKELVGVRYR